MLQLKSGNWTVLVYRLDSKSPLITVHQLKIKIITNFQSKYSVFLKNKFEMKISPNVSVFVGTYK